MRQATRERINREIADWRHDGLIDSDLAERLGARYAAGATIPAGVYQAVWMAAQHGGTGGKAADGGVHTFTIEAENPSHTERRSLYRGAIQVRR